MLVYLLIVNAASFALMLADKLRAKKNRWRIPERVLLGMALIGGSVGALAGMYLFRHKTRKPKFAIGVPVILIGQVILFITLY